jgi:uncharacterized sulfatase
LILFSSASAAPPNVVLIVGDDMGWTDFGFMGSKIVSTPHLDKLAKESAVFPNGYVPTSLCRASLATLLTGQHAFQHKICCNDPPEGLDRAAMHPFIKKAPALPRMLGEAGYLSFQTGKYWEGHYANAGFTAGMTVKGRHGDEGLVIGRKTMQPIYDFIERRDGKPFFLWYAPMLPHEPHDPPERLLKKYVQEGRDLRLAKYYAMCERFDETCGELLDYLDKHKLRDNTLVVFVIDNGWIQETGPKKTTRGNFAPKSKLSPYDGGVRTPVIVRWPGQVKPKRHDDLVSTIDIVPTILEACGLKKRDNQPGLSLLPTASGKGPVKRDAVFGEIYVHTSVAINTPALNLTQRWVRQGDWKLIVHHDGKTLPELYNVKDDPFEERNLAAKELARVAELTKRVDAWWTGRE